VAQEPSFAAESTFEAKGARYRLAALGASELAPVLPLFLDAFGREFSAEKLARKYACEAGGLAGFVSVAYADNGEAAGSVGVLPWPVRFGDRSEVAGQMVDVATSNAHRGRGLFVRLAEHAREVCESAGVAFLFGFPNEAAYPIWMKKLGYEHIHDLVEYRVAVRTVWAERVARRAEALRGIYERHVRRTLRPYVPADPVLENSLVAEGFAGIGRDREFHAYKASFNGSRVVSVPGGRAWVNLQHGLLIGDLEASSDEEMDTTLRGLERLARRLGLNQVVFQVSKGTRFSPFFESRARTLPGLPVIHRNLGSEIPAERLRFTFGDLDNF
jgi:GNAT superfamily N-acetyltransferase